jgi:hypothetical protein
MSKDQIIKPAVITAVAAAAANTTPVMQSRIGILSHAGQLTVTSLQALNEAQSPVTFGSCDDDTEVSPPLSLGHQTAG